MSYTTIHDRLLVSAGNGTFTSPILWALRPQVVHSPPRPKLAPFCGPGLSDHTCPHSPPALGPPGRSLPHVTTQKDACFSGTTPFVCAEGVASVCHKSMVSWRNTLVHVSGCCPCTRGGLPHATTDFSHIFVPSPIHHTPLFRARKLPALHRQP